MYGQAKDGQKGRYQGTVTFLLNGGTYLTSKLFFLCSFVEKVRGNDHLVNLDHFHFGRSADRVFHRDFHLSLRGYTSHHQRDLHGNVAVPVATPGLLDPPDVGPICHPNYCHFGHSHQDHRHCQTTHSISFFFS